MRAIRFASSLFATAFLTLALTGCSCGSGLGPLVVTVTAEPIEGRAPLSVDFTALIVGGDGDGGLIYDWDFGDGSDNSAEEAPNHVFTDGGSYEVSVTILRNEDGQTGVGTITITVTPNSDPSVLAAANPDMGLEPLTVQFQSLVNGGDGTLSYTWDFDDGGSSNLPSPTHTYTTAGSYDAVVTVVDDDGDTDSATVSIAVGSDDIPAATATATPEMGPAPLVVDFDCTAIGGNAPLTFAWDFGDGSNTSIATTTHTYSTSGVYVATCIVTDDDGSQGSDSVTITVGTDTIPTAIASATYTGAGVPLTVDFTGIGLGGEPPLTYDWDFGDGNTSTLQSPTNIYTSPGTYAAILTVTDSDGDFDVDTVTIVAGTGSVPVATASASPTIGPAPLVVTFTGTGTGGDGTITYDWSFGDGNTSTLQSPTNTYAADGTYGAVLTVTDSDGDFDVDTVTIVVGSDSVPVASASASPATGPNPLTVSFTGVAIGGDPPLTFDWDFGDGNTSTLQNPMNTYTADGIFSAILTVTDADGDFDVDTVMIDVFTDLTPTATAAALPTTGMVPLAVAFNGTGTGGDPPLSYSWNFGDGVTSPLEDPSHTYMASGTFDATLTVTDSDGDFDLDTVQIVVDPIPGNMPPTVIATATPTCAVPGQTLVQLDASMSSDPEMDPLSYNWVFVSVPPGSTASFNNPTVVNPTFVPDLAGFYDLRVFVSDGTNVVASAIQVVEAAGPSNIVLVAGEPQSTAVDTAFSSPSVFEVNVTSSCGAVVPNWPLTWSGTGLTPGMAATLTDGSGTGTNTATAGTVAGPASLTVTANGTMATFTMLTVDPGPPAILLMDPPATTQVTGPMTLSIRVTDQYFNTAATDVTFDICVQMGNATFSMLGGPGCSFGESTVGGTTTLDVYNDVAETVFFEMFNVSPPLLSGAGAIITVFSDDLDAGDDGNWSTWSSGVEMWELGPPTVVGPPGAYSGTNAWGTDLDASYQPAFFMGGGEDTNLNRFVDWSSLMAGPGPLGVWLTEWEYHDVNLDTNNCCSNGGLMMLSVCGPGGCVVPPDRGFNTNYCCWGDGNAEVSGGWVEVTYDLSSWVWDTADLTWTLARGGSATTGAGWYLDNITLEVAVQWVPGTFTAGPPAQVRVRTTNDGVVGCSDGRVEAFLEDAFGNQTGIDANLLWSVDGSASFTGPDVGFNFMPVGAQGATIDTDMGLAVLFVGDPVAESVVVTVQDTAMALMAGSDPVDFTLPGPEAGFCADGADNDCDGMTDCVDPDCVGDPACVGICGNGICEPADGEDSCWCGDCFCGDSVCDPCDPPFCPECGGGGCGDGFCDVPAGEDSCWCPDCFCGDGQCDGCEDPIMCPGDCGGGPMCGDMICDIAGGEDSCWCGDCFCGDGMCDPCEAISGICPAECP